MVELMMMRVDLQAGFDKISGWLITNFGLNSTKPQNRGCW